MLNGAPRGTWSSRAVRIQLTSLPDPATESTNDITSLVPAFNPPMGRIHHGSIPLLQVPHHEMKKATALQEDIRF